MRIGEEEKRRRQDQAKMRKGEEDKRRRRKEEKRGEREEEDLNIPPSIGCKRQDGMPKVKSQNNTEFISISYCVTLH